MARVAVFIDNSNVYKGLCSHIASSPTQWVTKHYNPFYLAQKLAGARDLVKVYFYCAPPPQKLFIENPDAFNNQNSYYAKIGKIPAIDIKFANLSINDGILTEKNLDTQLTSDVIMKAAQNEYDHAIIVSNDGDFVSAIVNAKQLGKKVEVAHFREKMSMSLRQSADITRRLRPSYFVQLNY